MDTNQFQNQLVPKLAIIDDHRLAELCELGEGSLSFAMELIDDLLQNRAVFFSTFESAIQQTNLSVLRQQAHKLKSSLANVAAGRAAKVCAEIESNSIAGTSIKTIAQLVELLKTEIALFENAVCKLRLGSEFT